MAPVTEESMFQIKMQNQMNANNARLYGSHLGMLHSMSISSAISIDLWTSTGAKDQVIVPDRISFPSRTIVGSDTVNPNVFIRHMFLGELSANCTTKQHVQLQELFTRGVVFTSTVPRRKVGRSSCVILQSSKAVQVTVGKATFTITAMTWLLHKVILRACFSVTNGAHYFGLAINHDNRLHGLDLRFLPWNKKH